MKFGYTILYVDDVEAAVAFYEKAFGFERSVVVPGQYGELATGDTKLAFAANSHVAKMIPVPFQAVGPKKPPAAVEIGLVTKDVAKAYAKAVAAGAVPLAEPAEKPWGQIVGYVRDLNGFLVEICTPMS